MKLDALLAAIVEPPADAGRIDITGVTADSRDVAAGALFAALPGTRTDGARFAAMAVERGAAAILAGTSAALGPVAVPVVRSDDPRRALALIAARFYARQPATIVAVTGTSGKTSVADFTRQIFSALGHRSASIGTIGVVRPDGGVYGALTTPDPVTLHRQLAELEGEGVTHLAFEASSHGLDQRRLDGVRVAAAAFTNLGRDHLDYHPTVAAYLEAKLRLFDTLLPGAESPRGPGTAVVATDLPEAPSILDICTRRGLGVLGVGTAASADLRLLEQVGDQLGQRLVIAYRGVTYTVSLPLIGNYQGSNAMLAAGLALAVGEPADNVFAAMARLEGVRGRLEIAAEFRGARIVIDYAHKPDALEAALDALRPFASGRLISVFGCGGDRDRGKRPIMGRISATRADITIVTDDNPRSEQPAAIRAEILAGCRAVQPPAGAAGAPPADQPAASRSATIEIGDRFDAIRHAMMQLESGDVLLIAGKGHETGQIVGDQVLPFSDHDAVAAVIGEIKA